MCFLITFYCKLVCRLFFTLLKNGNYCEICGKRIFRSLICETCFQNVFLEKISSARITKLTSSDCNEKENTIVHMKNESVLTSIDGLMCLFPYDLWNKNLLFKWKIKGERNLSYLFAEIVHLALMNNGIDTIVPVPPRPGKIKEKGWDQIDELCNFLNVFFGIRILKLLERKSKLQMKKLNREERLKMSESSYCLKSECDLEKELKKNKGIFPAEVCLIDDVMTTGATLENCGTCLKEGGVKKIVAVTLFKV